MAAIAERDNIEGQAFTSEVVRRAKNDFQCNRAHVESFYAGYCSLKVVVVGLILEWLMRILRIVY